MLYPIIKIKLPLELIPALINNLIHPGLTLIQIEAASPAHVAFSQGVLAVLGVDASEVITTIGEIKSKVM